MEAVVKKFWLSCVSTYKSNVVLAASAFGFCVQAFAILPYLEGILKALTK